MSIEGIQTKFAESDEQLLAQALAEAMQSDSPAGADDIPPALAARMSADEVTEWRLILQLQPVVWSLPPFHEGGILFSEGSGSGLGFHPQAVARFLLRTVRRGFTPEQAVAHLAAVLRIEQAECLAVLPLWGVEIDGPIDLVAGLSLLPFADLPESHGKTWVERASAGSFDAYLPLAAPPCALCYRYSVSPVFIRASTAPELPSQPLPIERLAEAVLPLALVGPSGPVAGPSWTQYLNQTLEQTKLGLLMHGRLTESISDIFRRNVRLSSDEVRSAVSEYLATTNQTRSRLRLSLTRFSRAMTRRDPGDKALDLAIALEALLTDGAGDNTFRTALRAGLLTEGSPSDRVRTRAVVTAVYSVRSAVVHNGVTPTDVSVWNAGKQPTGAVIDEGARIAAGILRRVIHDAKIPNWREFELGS